MSDNSDKSLRWRDVVSFNPDHLSDLVNAAVAGFFAYMAGAGVWGGLAVMWGLVTVTGAVREALKRKNPAGEGGGCS